MLRIDGSVPASETSSQLIQYSFQDYAASYRIDLVRIGEARWRPRAAQWYARGWTFVEGTLIIVGSDGESTSVIHKVSGI